MQKKFDNVLSRLLRQAAGHVVLSARPRILVAVSGGVDSIVLANLFYNTSVEVDFAIVHCNFSLRGSNSDADEQFVTFWALNRSITLYKTTFDTVGYASGRHLSIEMAARELRYDFFAKTALEEGFDAVAVAHNANDNAETLLLNLVRGTGLAGLGGMRDVSMSEQGLLVLRPLLDCTRKQIEAYAAAQGLFHCEDTTNSDTTYRRNFLRHKVLPQLEEINPSAVKTLCGEAEVFASAGDFAAFSARETVSRLVSAVQIGGGQYDKITLAELTAVPGWEYVLYVCLSENYGFNSATILSLVELIRSREEVTFAGKTFLSDGYSLVTASDGLLVGSRHSEGCRPKNPDSSLLFTSHPNDGLLIRHSEGSVTTEESRYTFNGTTFTVSLIAAKDVDMTAVRQGRIYAIDPDKCDFESSGLVVRGYKEGDYMLPFGLKGKKKISDVFADLKWSKPQKEAAVLFFAASEREQASGREKDCLLMLGYRISDKVRLTKDSKRALVIAPLQ